MKFTNVLVSYSIYHAFKFKNKHIIVWAIWRCDTNNDIKISASYNYNFLNLKISVLTGYSVIDNWVHKKQPIHKVGFAYFNVPDQFCSRNGIFVLTSHLCSVIWIWIPELNILVKWANVVVSYSKNKNKNNWK